jgi:UDP-N-acetylglucosamine--N-acetylmuramyl-(pentapeptide) pyrophosphoryl-undecaprenol N-acetylglucosamine transferase
MSAKTALIMAGGTGGHIFPGLAVAEELRARGWRVHWLGAPGSMEARIVPPHGFALETIDFSGVRGKGLATLALLPLRLLRAFWQAWWWCAGCSRMWWWAWAATSAFRAA